MRAEPATVQARYLSQRQEHGRTLQPGALKRKYSAFVASLRQDEVSYPSPPMSSPPSPSRTQPELPFSDSRAPVPTAPSSNDPITTLVPTLASSLPTVQPSFPFSAVGYPSTSAPFSIGLSATYAPQPIQPAGLSYPSGGQGPQSSRFGAPRLEPSTTSTQPGSSVAPRAGSSSTRGGRKAKAHVASACINCKRAHLSCDVQRPCPRCVATGKQDTCFDVQHKKRGRPRLREEGEFKVEQMLPEQTAQVQVAAGSSNTPARPIASTRHRRGESFRSLRSQTSEDSPIWSATSPNFPPSAALQSPFTYQPPPGPGSGRTGYEVPTALLDLDLVIIRANRSFEQIMLGGQGLRGRHLSDFAGPADNEGFQNIRNRLRTEREAREPAYMPPILQAGQDPLQGVSDTDIDRFTETFSDTRYTWVQTQLGPAAQTFPARVRLAKANIYFVVVTLPTFRPIEAIPMQALPPSYGAPLVVGPPLSSPESFFSPRQAVSQPAPPMAYSPFQTTAGPPHPIQPPAQQTSSRTYPPQHPQQQRPIPYQQQQTYTFQQLPAPATPRLPIAGPPTETTAFTPRSAPREVVQPTGPVERQLPPIVDSPTATARSRATTMDSGIQQASSEDGEGEESSRKRRRMGIDDVLQR